MMAGRSLRGIAFPVLFYKDVDKRTDKGNTASGAYIDAHLVVEYLLTAPCEVEIALYTVQGELLSVFPKREMRPGQYRESITIDPSLFRHYILRLVVNC